MEIPKIITNDHRQESYLILSDEMNKYIAAESSSVKYLM
jgi:hypothetical protein